MLGSSPAPPPRVLRAPRGWVGPAGLPLTAEGTPLALSNGCGRLNLSLFAYDRRPDVDTLVVDAPMVVLTSKWSYKFFHWIVEALPRLALVHQELATSHARLLTSCKGGLAKASLPLLGIPARQVVCWHQGRSYRSSHYLLWPEPSPCGGVTSSAAQALRRRALLPSYRPLQFSQKSAPHSVLLHRRHRHRRLLQHDSILSQLQGSYGRASVQVVNDSASLLTQVGLFRGARCQVGPHGAGLAMMLFAPDSFATAEISPGAYFVSVKDKPGMIGFVHLNRYRNRTGQTHEWLLVAGAKANDDMAVDALSVLSLAQKACVLRHPRE
ncbi:MAG: hypothetical protein SGPRY_009211 [Prymnesium sp.]